MNSQNTTIIICHNSTSTEYYIGCLKENSSISYTFIMLYIVNNLSESPIKISMQMHMAHANANTSLRDLWTCVS